MDYCCCCGRSLQEFDYFVRRELYKLYGHWPIRMCSESGDEHVSSSENMDEIYRFSAGLMPADAVIESSCTFYVVLPFVQYTLADLVTFSPSRLSHTSRLFVLYQILHAIRHLHALGLSVGNLRLRDIAVNDHLWIHLPPPPISMLCRPVKTQHCVGECLQSGTDDQWNKGSVHLNSNLHSGNALPVEPDKIAQPLDGPSQGDLASVVHKWVYGEISNFDYLMFLNNLAGRNFHDPNHYPILPWVMDFSSRSGGLRDLTKTKYRLNKGDEQLELTYDMAKMDSTSSDPTQTPFHVSDFLSDITYYVYKARRTDKSVLCRLVRHRWVPAHYPSSLERLYHWTPDECIPDFYTDAEIFESIHDDLHDLELPAWCTSADDFITNHRQVLESPAVSQQLHHWINLTFGYKVSNLCYCHHLVPFVCSCDVDLIHTSFSVVSSYTVTSAFKCV